ncbi:hypothetical protein WJX84_011950 [Apatococcus fuscideae]|uniref:PPM-type phosphatase domain-containing protein n=1 Tax=Apatococcus fuscideae TaxID=2026836 RepID=A0AAW1TC29_9CHLO
MLVTAEQLLSRNGKPVDLSAEHRVTGKSDAVKSEVQRVTDAGGWIEDGRVCDLIAVSRAFGGPLLQAHLVSTSWQRNLSKRAYEFLILATDGLWDVLSSKEAVKIARDAFQKQRSPEDIAGLLTERAYRKYSSDNVAVVVVDLGGPPGGWKASKPTGGLRGLFQ